MNVCMRQQCYIYQSSKRGNLDWALDLHPIIAVMSTRISIMAIRALTLRSTLDSRSEALTVIFATGRFLAGAPTGRYKGWDAFEVAGVAVVGDLLCVEDLSFIAWMILTASADAVGIAGSSLGETFTVQLQTIYLGTFAARVIMISLYIHFLVRQSIRRATSSISLLQQFLKKILNSLRSLTIINHPQPRIIISSSTSFLSLSSSEHLFSQLL